MKFKVGDKVKLTSNVYMDSSFNPLWGGKHGKVVGVVNATLGMRISVKWGSGTDNIYDEEDVSIVEPETADEYNEECFNNIK